MDSWIFYSTIAMLQFGLMMSLYKVPASKQISKYFLSTWSFLFSTLIAFVFLHQYIFLDPKTLFYAFLWGLGYSFLTLTQMHVLHKHDTSGVFPFTSLASNILVIIGGVLFFQDVISFTQWIAILISIFLFIGAHWNSKIHFVVDILPSFALISLLSTFNKFLQKMGATGLEIHNFIFWQSAFSLAVSIIILFFTTKNFSFSKFASRPLLLWVFLIGALNFGGSFYVIKALSLGQLSLVYVILGLYTFFTAIFASLLFKEKITRKSLVFIGLSFLVVLLIKFG